MQSSPADDIKRVFKAGEGNHTLTGLSFSISRNRFNGSTRTARKASALSAPSLCLCTVVHD